MAQNRFCESLAVILCKYVCIKHTHTERRGGGETKKENKWTSQVLESYSSITFQDIF